MSGVPPARTAMITGGGRGLGRSLASGLAEAGLSIGLLGRPSAALMETADEIAGTGGRVVLATADVRNYDAVVDAVAQIESAMGPIDLLVNNAGVIESVEEPIWAADPIDWWDVVETDLRGPFHCVRAVVPGMVERGGGRVIDLNSGAGAADREVYSAYCAAKAGLFRIGGAIHLAGHDRGLRSFEVSPGVVRSDMTSSMAMHADRTDWTPVAALVEIAVAVAGGALDAWSGCYLRAGVDTPASLRAAERSLTDDGQVPGPSRRLGVILWGPDDPLAN
jgi:3-oxoacyl-[acyl-carrier protein] reductase